MEGVTLRELVITDNKSEGSENGGSFIKVLKTTHFKKGNNLGCEVHEAYHFHPSKDFEESKIEVQNNNFQEQFEIGNEVNVISINNSPNCGESNEDISVIIENSSDEFRGNCCFFQSKGCFYTSNNCKNYPINLSYKGYTPLNGYDILLKDDRNNCIRSLITNLNLVLMLFSLLVPLFLHIFCEFRLYKNISKISNSTNIHKISDNGQVKEGILKYFGEFENFFFIGVILYIITELIGFFITHSRYNLYLNHLCIVSIETSKDNLLEKHKDDAIQNFLIYSKNLCIENKILKNTRRNLIKAFDQASYMFNDTKIDFIWDKLKILRLKIFFLKIWFTFILNILTSFFMCFYLYYKKFGLKHKVPLGHPGIISNMYWYVALQYEGFLWILSIFFLNIATWLYLCYINRHEHFFKTLEKSLKIIEHTMEEYTNQVAKNIWEREMFWIINNVYNSDQDSNYTYPEYTKFSIETKFSKENEDRTCLCNFMCNEIDQHQICIKPKFEDLSFKKMKRKLKRLWRRL